MTKIQTLANLLMCVLATVFGGAFLQACSNTGSDTELLDASESLREEGWSYYELRQIPNGLDIHVVGTEGPIGRAEYLFMTDDSLRTSLELEGSTDVLTIEGTADTFLLSLNGENIARREAGAVMTLGDATEAQDELTFLTMLTADPAIRRRLDERRAAASEQHTACVSADPELGEGLDDPRGGGDGDMPSAEEQGCGYFGCVAKVIFAETLIIGLVATLVAAGVGGVPACAGAIVTVAGAAACIAAVVALGVGVGKAFGNICSAVRDACVNACVPGCAPGDAGDMTNVMCPAGF